MNNNSSTALSSLYTVSRSTGEFSRDPARMLVIGCASLDILHFAGHTVSTVGGAGLYTALAAQHACAAVTLCAPRPALPLEPFNLLPKRLRWIGPQVPPQAMPRLEIAHHGRGRATLLQTAWGGEAALTPDHLEADLEAYDIVHIAALSSAQKQLMFLHACRDRGARRISAGTYARVVYGEKDIVRFLFEEADIFFMNENEAKGLFGSTPLARTEPGKLWFVTRGEGGATVYQGAGNGVASVAIPAEPAAELDPTGAGDTFCGATLAGLLRGESPVEAARNAARLAARCVEAPGPAALL